MKCLECQSDVSQLDNRHLNECCGLTLQEYAIRHHVSLDLLVHESMVNIEDDVAAYSLPSDNVSVRASSVIQALSYVDALKKDEQFISLQSDIRRLDELLWYLRELNAFGFQFRQEYQYRQSSHRVVPLNAIKTLSAYEHKFLSLNKAEIDFNLYLSIVIAQTGGLHAGYLYLSLPENNETQQLLQK